MTDERISGSEAAARYSAAVRARQQQDLAKHIPTLTEGGRIAGGWVTYCAECSRQAGDYVQQCTLRGTPSWWPPAVLVVAPQGGQEGRETPGVHPSEDPRGSGSQRGAQSR